MRSTPRKVGEAGPFFLQKVLASDYRTRSWTPKATSSASGWNVATPRTHRHRHRAELRAWHTLPLARLLGRGPQGRRHPGLHVVQIDHGPTRHGGDPRQHDLLSSTSRHQKSVHRRLPRPDPDSSPAHHWTRGRSSAAGCFLLQNVTAGASCVSTPDSGETFERPHPAPAARRGSGPDLDVHGLLKKPRGRPESMSPTKMAGCFLKCWDAPTPSLRVSPQATDVRPWTTCRFKVAEQATLDYYKRYRLEKAGIAVKRFARATGPGCARPSCSRPPRVTWSSWSTAWRRSQHAAAANPPPPPGQPVVLRPPGWTHLQSWPMWTSDGVNRFLPDVLSFRLTEQIIAHDGHQLATWPGERAHARTTNRDRPPGRTARWQTTFPSGWTTGPASATPPTCWPTSGVTIDVAADQAGRPPPAGYTVLLLRPVGNRNEVCTGATGRPGLRADHLDQRGDGRAMFYYQPPKSRALFFTVHS